MYQHLCAGQDKFHTRVSFSKQSFSGVEVQMIQRVPQQSKAWYALHKRVCDGNNQITLQMGQITQSDWLIVVIQTAYRTDDIFTKSFINPPCEREVRLRKCYKHL